MSKDPMEMAAEELDANYGKPELPASGQRRLMAGRRRHRRANGLA
jgi:hypothetical protein